MISKIDLNKIPSAFGVYLWKDKNEQILYVGKAKNIRKRVKQYLNGNLNSYKTSTMLQNSESLSFIVCTNEKESLLLEQELIKKHRPFYNILLLDDKKYPFIVVELRKKLEIKTRFYYKEEKNSFYYGPLPPGYGHKEIKNFLIHECLYYNGLLIENEDINFWKDKFEYAKKILSSSNKFLISRLKNQMHIASESEQYELARELRDVLIYLTNKKNDQGIDFNNNENFDVIAFYQINEYFLINIHHFVHGVFFLQEEHIVEIKIDEKETIYQFINQFYKFRNKPKKIITNFKIEQTNIFFQVDIIKPLKGKKLLALNNCLKNAKLNLHQKILEYSTKQTKYLKSKLFIESILNQQINDFIVIDNSNTNNTNIVSAIIYYKNFQPYYSNYRKYYLDQNLLQYSDVEYIKQGLLKYFSNNKNELPNLLIVDGSKQQIGEARKVFKKLSINLPIVGLVKNIKHQTNYLLTENNKKHIFYDQDVFNFFTKIQYEVDRFAKNYHHKKNIKISLEGFLKTVNGIGIKTEEKILNHFRTYANIYNATEDELIKVVSINLARKIIKKLKKIE